MIAVGDILQYRSPGATLWRTVGRIVRVEHALDFYCVEVNDLGYIIARDGFPMEANWSCEVRWSQKREIVVSRKLFAEPRAAHCLRITATKGARPLPLTAK